MSKTLVSRGTTIVIPDTSTWILLQLMATYLSFLYADFHNAVAVECTGL